MALRDLIAKLGYEVDPRSEGRVRSSLAGVKKLAVGLAAMFGTGAAAVAGLDRMLKQTAALGDNIAKTSKQIGVNAQRLQELRFAANLAGASNEDVTTGFRRLQASAKEAGDGTKSYVDDFRALGVEVRDGNNQLKSAEQLILEVADGMKNRLKTDTERTAIAQTLLGRSGTKLIPLLKQGSAAIQEQTARARELGEVYDEQLLVQSEDFVDAQRELQGAFQGLRNIIAREFLPIWTRLTRGTADFIAKNRSRLIPLAEAAARAFVSLGRALSFVFDMAKRFAIPLAIIAAILFPTTALFIALGAAILLVAEDLEVMREGGESVIGTLIDGFQALLLETGSVFGAISEIIKTAIAFWAEQFGIGEEAGQKFDEILLGIERDFRKIASFGRAVGDVFGAVGTGGLVGLGGAPAAQQQIAGGARSLVNQPSVNIIVQEAESAVATGVAVAQKVEGALERTFRQAKNAISIGSSE
jgi:hypothetical protein